MDLDLAERYFIEWNQFTQRRPGILRLPDDQLQESARRKDDPLLARRLVYRRQ